MKLSVHTLTTTHYPQFEILAQGWGKEHTKLVVNGTYAATIQIKIDSTHGATSRLHTPVPILLIDYVHPESRWMP